MKAPLTILEKIRTNFFHSNYGGFWTDLNNATDLLEGKKALGTITEEESIQLRHFIDKGYVILKNAIPYKLIDNFVMELNSIKNGDLEGFFVEYGENNKYYYGVPYTPDLINKKFKLIDIYSKSSLSRDINLHPNILRFISLIFERPILAFQSLSFFYGTQQPIHQDTAYVRVDSPMEMVASWIALEDIEEGTGELEFFEGSHKLPDYNFKGNPGLETWFGKGTSKWFDYQDQEEHNKYLKWLINESQICNYKYGKFIARKGDVLIWTNDFAHGGSKITKNHKSRLSLVTHYCPLNCNPLYFYTQLHSPKLRHSKIGYYSYKQVPGKSLPLDFDDDQYLKINSDVKQAGMNPKYHYLRHGIEEFRNYK